MKMPSRVLTIAGSAAGGSAGIQADLKTFQELDVYGMSVVTALVAKHPDTKKNVHLQTIEAIEAQFATAVEQVGVDTIKVGMLFSKEIIVAVAKLIEQSSVQHVVVDPVMIGKMNSRLLAEDAIESLQEKLLPLATIMTPNMPEASLLLGGRTLTHVEDLKKAAVDLWKLGSKAVLVKGGRLSGPAVDVLYDGSSVTTFEVPRINTEHTSGAGCTYSAAITANLSKGSSIEKSIRSAKEFVSTAIEHGFSYTNVVGPTYHAGLRKQGLAYKVKVEK
ncbi:pyridoxine kinase/hydroxymethylpyrimidine/phosphomethylpyrimidine kinase [Oceanobacillus limi]|uniref:pyridoxal kinase n=1 Tax=Oceanobacillus limi TaxID=930131 RepID=A0A1I0AUP4_9BACI|nr:bifunctional hydroxymethylpyrimidine kinase/phosphomethylpyrimidine kinase [Oceanobacillus limi]SES97912.1 pyridoxine kinase/hydroxymethylpyrimidine/phosphomethylpyrimidine kinase [Oceanobacillus limi]